MIMPTEFTQRTARGRQHWLLSVGAVAAASALVLTGCSGSGTSETPSPSPALTSAGPLTTGPSSAPASGDSATAAPRERSGVTSVARTFPVNRHPVAVAVDPAGQMLLVASRFDNVVSLFGLAGGELIADVPVGGSPAGIVVSPDGTPTLGAILLFGSYLAQWWVKRRRTNRDN